jgi:hypothetical protein
MMGYLNLLLRGLLVLVIRGAERGLMAVLRVGLKRIRRKEVR